MSNQSEELSMNTSASFTIVFAVVSLLLVGCKEPNLASSPVGPSSPVVDTTKAKDKKAKFLISDLCNVESVDGQLLANEAFELKGPANVRGWLADGAGKAPVAPMLVLADKNKNVVGRYLLEVKLDRPDVVKVFPDKQIQVKSGFELRLDPSVLTPNKAYHIYLSYTAGGLDYVCDNGRTIQLIE